MTLRSICILAGALVALASLPAAHAADKPANGQEAKCLQDAKGLKGEERDKYLAECPKPMGNQQNKMKTCNAEAKAKDLHGDERRAFMSTCLKG